MNLTKTQFYVGLFLFGAAIGWAATQTLETVPGFSTIAASLPAAG